MTEKSLSQSRSRPLSERLSRAAEEMEILTVDYDKSIMNPDETPLDGLTCKDLRGYSALMKEARDMLVASEKPATNTPDGHKARHVELHKALDELFADYIDQHPGEHNFLDAPLKNLIRWSYEQTINPSEKHHGK